MTEERSPKVDPDFHSDDADISGSTGVLCYDADNCLSEFKYFTSVSYSIYQTD